MLMAALLCAAMSGEPTFRDFAGAVLSNDMAKASATLSALLNLDAPAARAATEHFQLQMSTGPAFMMKAMGMREVVQGGDQDKLRALLSELFGLSKDAQETALAAIRARYPS